MPLADIRRLAGTVDGDRHSPVADAVAALWNFPPRTAVFRRSSASHVFALPNAYLRFVPATHRARAVVIATTELMRTLHERGLAVAQPIPSVAGALVEVVQTTVGDVHAMLVTAAPGEQIEADTLTPSRATAWGAALATLHRESDDVDLPDPFTDLHRVHDDPPLAEAGMRIAERLAALPRDPSRFGVVHGDFELDNLAWRGDAATAFDFDEAARSWFVADISRAVRDIPPGTEHFTTFLAGYRSIRPLPEPDVTLLPLFTAAYAVCTVVHLRSALGTASTDDPPWVTRLRTRLFAHADRMREIALAL